MRLFGHGRYRFDESVVYRGIFTMSYSLDEMPILRQLIQHTSMSRLPLHMPGHHQGRDLPMILSEWLGAAAKIDLTELPGLDNLQGAHECILDSQRLTANYYGSTVSYYSVNGSSACIMAAICACTKMKRRILVVGPFHISAWRGFVLADAQPTLISADWDAQENMFAPIAAQKVQAYLQYDSDVAAVYLTSPSYQGIVAPVQEIIEIAHRFGLPVIVDEAHGAHFGLINEFPEHSVRLGADIVVQSVHKMLPGLTQTAWIHVQGNLVDAASIQRWILHLQSTSPSYLLLASIDAAQAWLRFEGSSAAKEAYGLLQPLYRPYGEQLEWFRDPLKHWIPTGDLTSSRRLYNQLATQGIFVEYADENGVLAIFGFRIAKRELYRYLQTVEQWREETIKKPSNADLIPVMYDGEFLCSPREAERLARRNIPLQDSVGCLSADVVVPYPPGIPMIWPGQLLTKEVVDMLQYRMRLGLSILGINEEGKISILFEPPKGT